MLQVATPQYVPSKIHHSYHSQMMPYQHAIGQQPTQAGGRPIERSHVSAGHMISYPPNVQGQYPPQMHGGFNAYGARSVPMHQAEHMTGRNVTYPYLPEGSLLQYRGPSVQAPPPRVYPQDLSQAGNVERQTASRAPFPAAPSTSSQRRGGEAPHLSATKGPSTAATSATASTFFSGSLTYTGHIKTSADAILLLAACDLPPDASVPGASGSSGTEFSSTSASPPPRRIQRRLLEAERAELVKSGSVFAWDEDEAGMRRWTDGRCWSASRVSGCFLTYRELEARKRSPNDPTGPRTNQYKIDGLIKQSFSMVTTSGRKVHIVSYYTKKDIREGRLGRVSEDPRFVGEAGGEWGLHIDEDEYPDPIVAVEAHSVGNEEERCSSPAVVASDGVLDISTGRPPKSTENSVDKHQAEGTSSLVVEQPASLKRPLEGVDELVQSTNAAVRPPIKRLRSSSTGELKRLRANGGASASGTLLTESNMRNAGFETAHEQQQRQHGEQHWDITRRRQLGGDEISPAVQAERDGSAAAGALLSLRLNGPLSALGRGPGLSRPSFLDAHGVGQRSMGAGSVSTPQSSGSLLRLSSTRSYLDSGNDSGSVGTPLTSPEEGSPPLKTSPKDTAALSVMRRRSDGATPIGERSDSDKDTLSRLGVRV